MRLSAKKLLEQCGFTNITLASSGAEAWKLLCSADETDRPFDLILSDLNLPEFRGVETITHLNEVAKKIPIVVMTGMKDERVAGSVHSSFVPSAAQCRPFVFILTTSSFNSVLTRPIL